MLKNVGLFCKRDLQKRPIFCKETCIFKHPTHRSHPITIIRSLSNNIHGAQANNILLHYHITNSYLTMQKLTLKNVLPSVMCSNHNNTNIHIHYAKADSAFLHDYTTHYYLIMQKLTLENVLPSVMCLKAI